jgi:PAS domain S-box-containing protein
MSVPLRFSIPVAFIALSITLTGIGTIHTWLTSFRGAEDQTIHNAASLAHTVGPAIEHAILQGEKTIADDEVERIALMPDLSLALVCDEADRVISSTDFTFLKRDFGESMPAAAAILSRARDTMTVQTEIARDGDSVQTAFPLYLEVQPGELRPSRVGIFYIQMDLLGPKTEAVNGILQRVLIMSATALLASLLFWAYLRFTFTRQLDRLVEGVTAYNLEKGDLRVSEAGNHELSQIGRVLNQLFGELMDERKALRESEGKYRSLVEQAGDGIFLTDPQGNYLEVNPSGCAMLGYTREEILKLNMRDLVSPEDQSAAPLRLKELREGKVIISERNMVRKDGSLLQVEISGKQLDDGRLQGIVRDMTVRKQTEEALVNAQRLDSLGILAGGIAHDFNNLLGGIFGYIEMAVSSSGEEAVSGYLARALGSIDRARALTRQLLTFAKGGEPVKKRDRLFPFIREAVLFALSGSGAACGFEVPDNLWICDYDRNQIGQVMDNVIINALQAMPDAGKIEVTAANIAIGENGHITLPAGNYVMISIRDHGIGMSRQVIPRIFEPFFTTKPKGHGLGLASCYSIVHRHGGCIDVESEPGKGSTFHVYLPASLEPVTTGAGNPAQSREKTGTILVMDDEEVIRETTAAMLKSLGYDAVCVKNGTEAIDSFLRATESGHCFTAMIFDLTVPGEMGGKVAISAVRRINPDIPVFVSSGYAEDPIMANPMEYGFTASLCKPFSRGELAEMLNRHIEPNAK